MIEIRAIDKTIYASQLAAFLPAQIIDIHTHAWLRAFVRDDFHDPRLAKWPERVAADNSIEDLLASYRLLLPGKKVTPMVFGWPERSVDLAQTNAYISRVCREHGLPGLLVSDPAWSAAQVEELVSTHVLRGLKPYLSLAPLALKTEEVTVYDFLPEAHLEVANAHGWIIMLHVPRPGRLKDPVNLQHLLEIERRYPRARVIVAHIGRAYCAPDVGNAFEVLAETERLLFDFSANTNSHVMADLLRAVGPRRVLFGSDLPATRMRMRRICEGGNYINLVPEGLYGDISDDPHMREVNPEEGERLSLFLYEELMAFRQAAEAVNLTTNDIADIFHNNAARLLDGTGSPA